MSHKTGHRIVNYSNHLYGKMYRTMRAALLNEKKPQQQKQRTHKYRYGVFFLFAWIISLYATDRHANRRLSMYGAIYIFFFQHTMGSINFTFFACII